MKSRYQQADVLEMHEETESGDDEADEQQQALLKVQTENADLKNKLKELQLHLERKKECVICQDADKCVALFPCNHLALCAECQHLVDECPICREKIEEKKTLFV